MQIFINETSLHEQYIEPAHFFDSLKIFLSCIKKIREIQRDKEVFKSNSFFYYTGITGTYFESTLKMNHSLNKAFVQNFQMLNPKSWQKYKIQCDTCSYEFKGENLVGTSVAEITERKCQDKNLSGFLLNFTDSKYGEEPSISILKNKEEAIIVDCIVTSDAFEKWLLENGYIDPEEIYNENSGIAPTDWQTVLRDSSLFEKTNYPKNNGRIVYRRIGTNELWVVDSALKHAGAKAHIEIFNENTKEHIGTSLYSQINLDVRYQKSNRYINLG